MSVNELSYLSKSEGNISAKTLLSALKGRVKITKVTSETSFSNSFNISSLLNKGNHNLNFVWKVLLRFSSFIYFIYLFYFLVSI